MQRAVDFIIALIGIFLTAPVLVILWIMVRIKHGSPVLFRQIRPGRYGEPFTMYKFRTMTNECDAEGNFLPDAQRLTGFGKFMRSTSLDELPELFNVLKGNMNVVGPRPLLMEYLPYYTLEQARRHEVRPGITGWAQVNGRNALSWEEKLKLDIWYVDNRSFYLNMRILWLTAGTVLRRDGISQEGSVTMEKFRGSNPEVDSK
jgi:lipopolysaccharide/colanic/teichoic acid biosynthesis glycosyltransferase